MNSSELKKIKKSLPDNYKKILGEQFGYHPNSIYRCLFGKRKKVNTQILLAAISLAKNHQKSLKKIQGKVKEL